MTRGCLRCGEEGAGVSMTLVDLEAEAKADGGRIRSVQVDLFDRELEGPHGPRGMVRSVVPERYGAEWRCRDRAACDQRVRAEQQEGADAR